MLRRLQQNLPQSIRESLGAFSGTSSERFVGRLVRFKAPCDVPTCETLKEGDPSEIPNTLKLVKRNCRKDCTVFTVILFTDLRDPLLWVGVVSVRFSYFVFGKSRGVDLTPNNKKEHACTKFTNQ